MKCDFQAFVNAISINDKNLILSLRRIKIGLIRKPSNKSELSSWIFDEVKQVPWLVVIMLVEVDDNEVVKG